MSKAYVLLVLVAFYCAISQSSSVAQNSDPQSAFELAGGAYDEGDVSRAAELYNKLVSDGYEDDAIFFNLGNAYFRGGKLGLAVLNYAKALRVNPRDVDAKANLIFGMKTSGAAQPSASFFAKLFSFFSLKEWMLSAIIIYWVISAAICAYLLSDKRRPTYKRLIIIFAAIFVISVVGTSRGVLLKLRPEAVVVSSGQKALFAPIIGSVAHFSLPEGSIVRVQGESGDWVKVKAGKKLGWIPKSICEVIN